MYHSTRKCMITLRCVLLLVLSDQPMGNAITGIRGPTGIQGNRHYYHNSSDLHVCYLQFVISYF